jgi:hypothetical protein
MQRTILTSLIAGAVLALNAGVASANTFPFDDPYWKQAPERTSVQATAVTKSKYDLVDNYNP